MTIIEYSSRNTWIPIFIGMVFIINSLPILTKSLFVYTLYERETLVSGYILNLFHEAGQEILFLHHRYLFPPLKYNAFALAAGDADIGVFSLARAIDHASHYRYFNGLVYFLQSFLYFPCQLYHINFGAAAGGAANEDGPSFSEVEAF